MYPVPGLGEAKDALRLLHRLDGFSILKNNPWVMPPEAVVEMGGAVLKYYQDVEEAERVGAQIEELQLLKVVLVGSSQAGKTRWDQPQRQRKRGAHSLSDLLRFHSTYPDTEITSFVLITLLHSTRFVKMR